MPSRAKGWLLVAALAGLAVAVGRAALEIERGLAAERECEAVAAGRLAEVLELPPLAPVDDETHGLQLGCRCRALVLAGRVEACDLLLAALGPGLPTHWVEAGDLLVPVIEARERRQGPAAARSLAEAAAARFPDHLALATLELDVLAAAEGEPHALAAVAARRTRAVETDELVRILVAQRKRKGGDAEAALALLGPRPAQSSTTATALWFDARGNALGALGRRADVLANYEAYAAASGRRAEAEAWLAMVLDMNALGTAEELTARLRRASAGVRGTILEERVVTRLVGRLLADGDRDGALATYDEAKGRLALRSLRREDLSSNRMPLAAARVRVVFRGLPPGELWVSPPLDRPPSDPLQAQPVDGAMAVVEWTPGPQPLRYVARDRSGATVASGVRWPAGPEEEVRVTAGAGVRPAPATLALRPADGRRRVYVLIYDCGDWRLVRYLRARGELPVLGALLDASFVAELDSYPAFTAAALKSLVWPTEDRRTAWIGAVHELGLELAGLASVGTNPFAALGELLPEEESLFLRVGRGPRSAANLLFSHGAVKAGRHAEVVGPEGRRSTLPVARSRRGLTPAELATFADLRLGSDIEAIAAQMDAMVELVSAAALDLVLLRVEALDLVTHTHFARAVAAGQDDGRGVLYETYRYLDARLAEVVAALDGDDLFVLMSDHGIESALVHDRAAMFVAFGAGVRPGRAEGRPSLVGVPRFLAVALGVDAAGWPSSGLEENLVNP